MPILKKLIRNGCEYNVGGGDMPTYIDFLLVGGGGAGGSMKTNNCCYLGGGGGAGGYIECENMIIPSGTYNVTIGAGGCAWCGYIQHFDSSGNGCDSCFGDFVAYGGGLGAGIHDCYNTTWRGGCCGGSGGGGGRCVNNTYTPGCGYRCQGNEGSLATQYGLMAAGGGGAGCPGGTPSGTYQLAGGTGKCSCISGELKRYAGGGGGAMGSGYSNPGGCGGGGKGGQYNVAISSDCINASYYGGGGGGGVCGANTSCACGSGLGGNGYQGVLIIRYPSSAGYNITGGNSCYECNGYCIHCFTSDGTLTVS